MFAGVRQQMCYCSHMELTVASSGCCCCCCCWCYCLFIVYRLPLQLHTHSHRQRACVCALMKTKHTHTRDTTRTQAHAHTHTSARARNLRRNRKALYFLVVVVRFVAVDLAFFCFLPNAILLDFVFSAIRFLRFALCFCFAFISAYFALPLDFLFKLS